jgi:heat shock protein HslJ
MRIARLTAGLILTLLCISSQAQTPGKKLTVNGKLSRAMAIGGETTGWVIQLESEITIDGKQVDSIELDYHKTSKLEKLENQRVQVVGTLSHRQGVETGQRTVLVASSIREAKATGQSKSAPAAPFSLTGSEWLLEDLAGSGVMDGIQATLTFPEARKIAGNGSCNRFFGSAEISGDTIKLGPLASTRMACPEAVMNREMKYLAALQAAERFEWKDPYLLIYCKGFEKPLRFRRLPPKPAQTYSDRPDGN